MVHVKIRKKDQSYSITRTWPQLRGLDAQKYLHITTNKAYIQHVYVLTSSIAKVGSLYLLYCSTHGQWLALEEDSREDQAKQEREGGQDHQGRGAIFLFFPRQFLRGSHDCSADKLQHLWDCHNRVVDIVG